VLIEITICSLERKDLMPTIKIALVQMLCEKGAIDRNLASIHTYLQAGRTQDEDFPGGGNVFGPDGTCICATSDWSEGMLYAIVTVE
jgi:predicted amidohydrolase